jgi:putative transposase
MEKRVKRRGKKTVGERGSAPPTAHSGIHYWHGGHTRHRLLVHLVFCPKYRRPVLNSALTSRLSDLFYQCCEVNHWYIHELNIQLDHVHLLLQYSPSESLSDIVGRLKGGSSRVLRLEFPDLEEFLWGSSFWSDGYFSESVGVVEEDVLRAYVRDQAHHIVY